MRTELRRRWSGGGSHAELCLRGGSLVARGTYVKHCTAKYDLLPSRTSSTQLGGSSVCCTLRALFIPLLSYFLDNYL